jgi:catechol 2,3-dioxygenase-like lactoylglutathione lyase family enzyme
MDAPFDQQVTFIYTRDLEKSAVFYGGTLGLPLILDQGACRIYQVSRDGFVGVCRCRDDRPSSPDGIIITLVSDDVDGWHERLRQQGVEFDTPPAENAKFNIYHCFLTDPDGHQIEIQQFRDPSWPKPS